MTRLRSILISNDDIPASGQVRSLTIQGDVNSKVLVQISSSNNTFYNFTTQSFTSSYTPNNNLSLTLDFSSAIINISFPAATGVSYFIIVTPAPNSDTIVSDNLLITRLSTVANSTITLAAFTSTTAKYSTDPAFANITSTGSPFDRVKKILAIDKTITNATTDANSNGLFITKTNISSKDFFHQTTEDIVSNPAGDAVSNTSVIVADLTDLVVGMTLFYHKGTTAPTAGTIIKSIDKITKTITFNKAVAFEDTETMTFRAIGLSQINKALNCDIIFEKANAKSNQKNINITPVVREITTTVRVAPSNSTTINIAATQGIPGGSTATFNGFKVDNSSTNNVNAVTPDPDGSDTDGVITCDVNQTLTVGTKLTFRPVNSNHFLTTQSAIKINLIVQKFPAASKTINLNLDNFITPGAAS